MNDPAKRSIIAIATGVILVNLAFGQAFLFVKKEQAVEQFTLPQAVEHPIRNSSVLAALISPEPEDNSLIISQNSSILNNSAPSAVPGREIIYYEVDIHDTVSTIAARFGVSTNTVLWANGLNANDYILPGQQLIILPISGVLHKIKKNDTISSIANQYNANIDKIIDFNGIAEELEIGKLVIVPGGVIKPSQAKPYVNTKLPKLKNYWVYPTTGRISQGPHGSTRNAIDIANECGTPVYAAAAGEIIIADTSGWNGGAGLYVKIEHNNGISSLYAHLSKILIQEGQKAAKGQQIGLMGHTGHTIPAGPDGCHLHFDVYGAKNPLIN